MPWPSISASFGTYRRSITAPSGSGWNAPTSGCRLGLRAGFFPETNGAAKRHRIPPHIAEEAAAPMTSFTINGKPVKVDADPKTPLLLVIRDMVGLTGTKFGCGGGFCGACTVHL